MPEYNDDESPGVPDLSGLDVLDEMFYGKKGEVSSYPQLLPEDLNYLVNNLPKDVKKLLKDNPNIRLAGGYKISPESMGKVIGRLIGGFKCDIRPVEEQFNSRIIISLLREVDPLNIIDGVESVEGNNNEPEEEE